ncbi:Uma2 family endonuclease [Synechococcales cyanobacterium C]|uniref:Uma2 family endonuclease n=1 Tax=Petrachloros mirabilis ULC683 TaxID=2781853 RepID=A0A8K2A929_9CYAN|nr:Uma2 family endonuclease [Petrachloros mirabilis]NCJ07705.1 Uma2 family endonuclease [Petrachloros mirabilis ULC683]
MAQELLNSETHQFEISDEHPDGIVTALDTSHLVIEDDTPVDNFQSAQQQRLLIDPLYATRPIALPFIAEADVGLFYKLKSDPVVPDMLLSLGVKRAEDFSQRENRTYFVWQFGKVPDVCIEIVSNQEGDELSISQKPQRKGKMRSKKDIYAQVGVPYYVVFDPLQQIQGDQDMGEALLRVWTISPTGYTELTLPSGVASVGELVWLDGIGLGLTLWQGAYEEETPRLWLRWCDQKGQVILTGAEGQAAERQRADQERQRADQEHQRAEQAQQRLEQERQRAEQAQQRADQERQRAEQAQQRLEQLEALMRTQGIDLNQFPEG